VLRLNFRPGLVMDIGGHQRVLLGVDHNFEVIQLRRDLRLSPVRFGLVRKPDSPALLRALAHGLQALAMLLTTVAHASVAAPRSPQTVPARSLQRRQTAAIQLCFFLSLSRRGRVAVTPAGRSVLTLAKKFPHMGAPSRRYHAWVVWQRDVVRCRVQQLVQPIHRYLCLCWK